MSLPDATVSPPLLCGSETVDYESVGSAFVWSHMRRFEVMLNPRSPASTLAGYNSLSSLPMKPVLDYQGPWNDTPTNAPPDVHVFRPQWHGAGSNSHPKPKSEQNLPILYHQKSGDNA